MLAEDILSLDFSDSSVRKRIEFYNYGLASAKTGWVDFNQLHKILNKISKDQEEKNQLRDEFIKGFSEALL
ncbi:hypothetical protein [Sphingobacterium siyangense]|uniref:hypothetical protein n=1 Tax=Sphingobacterium siyangense TaxID=459529 RepID=UPI00196531E2|nr:hypothetical protein [Sphingobacterium siyangense]QRY55496.1 hypothetical protein JVX97_15760 [Sphingobacterium siyangense]